MRVDRRTFIFASRSFTIPAAYQGDLIIAHVEGSPRWVSEIVFSNMPMGDEWKDLPEDPSMITVRRGDETVYAFDMNPRATQRWVAMNGSEHKCDDRNLLQITFEPAYTVCSITLGSWLAEPILKPPDFRPAPFRWDPFRWIDGKIVVETDNAVAWKIRSMADKSS